MGDKDEPVGKAGTEVDVADLGKRLLGDKGTGTMDWPPSGGVVRAGTGDWLVSIRQGTFGKMKRNGATKS